MAGFPRIFLPSGSNNVGDSHPSFAAASVDQKRLEGGWSAFGRGGCTVTERRALAFCQTGAVLTYQFLPKLQIGAEIFHQTADSSGTPATSSASIGWRFDLNDNYHLLGYVRHGIENANETEKYSWYASATASLPSGFIADVSKKGLKKSPSTGGAVALDGAHDLAAYIWPDGTAGPFPDYFVSAAVASSIAAGILATDRSERDLVEQLISVFLLGQGF
jgi:hypothetical protein